MLYNKFDYKDINDFIMAIPGYSYWKNIESIYMGCNKSLADASYLKSPKDIIGKTDKDFLWGKDNFELFQEEDQYVIKNKRTLIKEHKLPINGVDRIYRTTKNPIINKKGQVFGILGQSIDITLEKESTLLKIQNETLKIKIESLEFMKESISNLLHVIQTTQLKILNNNLIINPEDKNIKLSKREKQILYYLSINKSVKEIALIIGVKENKELAPSTILSIINKQLYYKFNVNSLGKLLEKAILLNLIHFLPPE